MLEMIGHHELGLFEPVATNGKESKLGAKSVFIMVSSVFQDHVLQ